MRKISYIRPNLTYLNIIFGTTLLILVFLSIKFFQRIDNISTSSDMIDHTYKVIYMSAKIKNNLDEVESHAKSFLLNNDSDSYYSYSRSANYVLSLLDSIKKLTEDNVTQQKNISHLQGWVSLRLNYLGQSIHLKKDSTLFKEKMIQGKNAMDSCYAFFDYVTNEESKLLNERDKTRQNFMNAAPQYFRLVFIFSFIIFVISFLFISKELKRRTEYQKELERKLLELDRLNSDLQEFSFIASHNLQEPVRKIRVFSNLLTTKHKDGIDAKANLIVEKMDASAAKIHELINDFVDFINIHNTDEPISLVDLESVIGEAASAFKNNTGEESFNISTGELLKINGYPKQLSALFKCLLDNSIKFSKKGTPAKIKIYGEKILHKDLPRNKTHAIKSPYYRISVTDNGIGFNNIFSAKIFKLFQRLDHEDNDGSTKGMGLAIAEHIMINHHGFVTAEGKPGEGAVFYLYFPMEE